MPQRINFANCRQFLIVFYVAINLFFYQNAECQKIATYSCVSGTQTFTVPVGMCKIKVKAWGAGSGGGGVDAYPGGAGSGGSYAELIINVSAGDVLTLYTGCRGNGGIGCGANYQGGIGGWGYGVGGTGGASGPVPCSGSGGGGGGSSGVLLNGALVIAASGGGGGGGAGCTSAGGIGGAGGQNGGASSCTGGGTAAINGNYNGATGSTHSADGGGGGGGGGGAFNGGQGGFAPPSGNSCNPSNDCGAGGGAGGNSFAPGGVIINGSGITPGNSGDPDLCGSCGYGGGSQAAGTDGYIVIYNVPSVMTSTTNFTDVLCNGGNDGSASVTASGGTTPYSYTWSNSTSLQQALNLSSGDYFVTVTDANKCKKLDTVKVSEPSLIQVSTSQNDVSCSGFNDGDASVVVNGGKPPYSYAWNTNPIQSNSQATLLSAGNYSVSISDANGCKSVSSFTISQPSPLLVNTNKTDVSCFQGTDGTATILASGGSLAYNYTWNTSPAQSTQTATNLKPGNYDLTVSDAHGCVISTQVQITEPSQLQASISNFTAVSCKGGKNGTASVIASGGTSAYSYSWNSVPAKTVQNAVGFPAGTYTVTVTDAKLCKASANVTIKELAALISNITSTVISCKGGNDGTASVSCSGGISPYTYSWNTIPIQTNDTAFSLKAATYIVTVTDSNSCKTVNAIQVLEPNIISIGSIIKNVSCKGKSDGSITALPSGGNSPYKYVWNIVPLSSNSKISGLKPGNYDVTVTDSKGCLGSASFNISEPATLSASHTQTDVSCKGGNDGTASAIAVGGSTPYAYSWNTVSVQTDVKSTNLSANTYVVIVTDINNCIAKDTVKIIEPPLLSINITGNKNVSCKNGNDGSAIVNAQGGTLPYSYLWSSVPSQNTDHASNLSAGNYSVTVSDGKSCTSILQFIITEPNLLNVNIGNVVNVSCKSGNNGSAIANVSGGTKPYSYLWNTNPVQKNTQAQFLNAGNYQILVTDSNQCTAASNIIITEPAALISNIVSSKNVSCFGGNDGSANAAIVGGTLPYNFAWSTMPVQSTQNASTLKAGNYFLTVTDKLGCKDSTNIQINEPASIQLSFGLITNVSCFNSGNGSASVQALGGTPPYSYSWNTIPIQTDAKAQSLQAGLYTVIVTDSLSCNSQASIQIAGPPALVVNPGNISNVSCFGGNDGSVIVHTTGGAPKYSFLWDTNPAQTDSNAIGLIAGNYNLTVSDSQNCQVKLSIQIQEPTKLSATVTNKKDVSCFSYQDGSILISESGGTNPYAYVWAGGESTAGINGLAAGSYHVSVTDTKNCVDTLNIQIHEPSVLIAKTNLIKNASCKSGNNGKAVVIPSGGTFPYQYSWNTLPTQSTDTAFGLKAGTYMLSLTDSHGCSDTSMIRILEPDSLLIAAIGTSTICIGQNAIINVSSNGGSPPYTYLWNTGEIGSSITVSPDTSSSYSVIARDSNLCISSIDSVTITVRPPLDIQSFPVNPICKNESVNLQAAAQGGDGNYSFQWMPLALNGPGPFPVSPSFTTTYTVTVNDGCGTPSDVDSVVVHINSLPQVNFSGDTLKGCIPHTVNFMDLSSILSPSIISGWHWNMGDPMSVNNSSSLENPEHTYLEAGIYSVGLVVTSLEGCSDSLTKYAYVSVYPPPVSDFISDKDTVQIFKPEFSFYEKAKGEISYEWDFGDGFTSKDSNPKHIYEEAGSYQVCLRVTSAFKCIDTYCKTIFVEPGFTFYIPNAFTPDGDGLNDFFGGAGMGIDAYEMHIFDRWGNMIFLSESLERRWDGRANGGKEIAQMDVYLYMIKIKDIFDRDHSFVGHVTLVK